jgi:hypothetical protein
VIEPTSKKLLDRVRDAIRLKHYSIRTEQSYVNWIKRYIFFHNVRHPDQMGAAEVEAYLTHLAVKEHVAASTRTRPSAPSCSCIVRCFTRIWVLWMPCAPNAPNDCPPS